MSALLWAMVLLPAVTGGVLSLRGGDGSSPLAPQQGAASGRHTPLLALTVAAAVLGLAVAAAVTRPTARAPFLPGGSLELAADGLSSVMSVTVAAVGLLVLLFAAAHLSAERPRFFGLMLLFEAAVLLTVTATTLPALLLAWEVMGATSYALIAFHRREDEPVTAGGVAFLTTRAGDLGLYLAAGAAFAGATGPAPALSLEALTALHGPWLDLAAAGILLAALGKAAQLPFSFWLSRAMLGPGPVSALLHSAAMVAMGGYLLLRTRPLLEAAGWAADAAAWTGALTALLLGAVALAQRDLKQLLAASTGAQLGFVFLAAGVGGIAGGTAHLVAHAAVKSLLFLVAGAWLTRFGTGQLRSLRGAARRRGVAGGAFTVGALALAGVPPLSLWATKDEILAAVGSPALYGVTLTAALLSALYAGKAVGLLLRPAPEGNRSPQENREEPRQPSAARGRRVLETVPLLVLAAGAALLGLFALPPFAGPLKATVGATGEPSAGAATAVVSGLVALAGAGAAAWLAPRIPEPAWARSWLHLETAVRFLVVRPCLGTARALARFDDAVLDRAVMAAPAAVRRLASRAASADRRRVDGLVRAVAAGARRLGELARRPQTGQLHHYYAQAVVLLSAAVVLLLLLR